MSKIALVWPAAALALLSFVVMLLMMRRRIAAIRGRQVSLGYFRTYRGDSGQGDSGLPDTAVQAARQYENLFELPVLFYALVAILIAIPFTDLILVVLAWAFVLARYAHAIVHLGSNDVMQRFRVFALSAVLLLAMWIYAIAKLIARGALL